MLAFRVSGLVALFFAIAFSQASAFAPAAAKALAQTGENAPEPTESRFPKIAAQALDKTPITLPMELAGKQNLLLLSWTRDQAGQLDTWNAVGQALVHAYPDVRVYRMPVSPPENALYRWWDNSSLRSAETDPEMLRCTVPLYIDKIALRRDLGLPGNDHLIAALLVSRSGQVLWKAQGPSTPAERASLLNAVQDAR